MQLMTTLKNARYIAFFPRTDDGRAQAFGLRARGGLMKHARITEAIQATPSRIRFGAVYERGHWNPEPVQEAPTP